MAVLDRVLPDGADIVVDAGNIGASAIHHLPVRRDGRFVVALGMGGMGYSFGAGIGMAFARAADTGGRTVVISGDGSFFMHGMEIHTALQYRLPITFLLFDNHAHAMCVTREQLFYGDHYSYNRFGPSRLGAGLAAMFPTLRSVDVHELAALPDALVGALDVDGPSVISIECSADEIPPFAAFLGNAADAVSQPHIAKEEHSMSLPALEDITVHRGTADPIDGVIRVETAPREKATPIIMEMMRSVYPHDEVFGTYCTVNDYVDCPPDELFDYMADTRCLEEWTYSLRGFEPTEEPGLWVAYDKLGGETGSPIFTRTVANRDAGRSTTTARGIRASTSG